MQYDLLVVEEKLPISYVPSPDICEFNGDSHHESLETEMLSNFYKAIKFQQEPGE